ncbi:MAG: hypothetical protein MR009_09170 [Sutterellaceae bacterium]|nr:hypothetical protein [Sutterellaceae bacterium]MDD7441411.1 hypothetical protein [Sutterellaceae bacterium]MDY2869049.1 hypothetical protein [Mesosutterella sp.]
MDSLSQFRSIDELIRALDREKKLLEDMFERRKSLSYRENYALVFTDFKRERIRFLIEHGVIHENGDFLELEDVYVQFFEEVLDVNEEISVASVKEAIGALRENIGYFLAETNAGRRLKYQSNVKKILRRIGLRTLKNVVDLKRNVDTAYKQEPSFTIKKQKLQNLDRKREAIKSLIRETEALLGDRLFFTLADDPSMQRISMDVRGDFTEADHNLLEIERQIISYINQTERQSELLKKLQRLKYLKDQLTWREDTNVGELLRKRNPVLFEPRPWNRILLSLGRLSSDEAAQAIVRRVAARSGLRRSARGEAPEIDPEFLTVTTEETDAVDTASLWNGFRAQGSDLFTFIRNYDYRRERTIEDHVVLFCQMAALYADSLRFSERRATIGNYEYELIYAS